MNDEAVADFFAQTPVSPSPRREDPFAAWRQELADYSIEMKSLRNQLPDVAIGWISSVSARVLEMLLLTLENDSRPATRFRVETLIPVRDECRFQFQVASRRHSVSEMDWQITRGYAS